MDTLWSITTTIREAERVPDFLRIAKEIENEEWNEETQMKFQILLIKNREYLNPYRTKNKTQALSKLNDEQKELLEDLSISMTYEQAKEIFVAKQYKDPPMRGRNSMSPLEKLGLIDKTTGFIKFTPVGNMLYNNEIKYEDFLFETFLKMQYSNPIETERQSWNSKPFINVLRLIKRVNELCVENKIKEKGLTKIEFGIFALSIRHFNDIEDIAHKVIEFRANYNKLSSNAEKENFRKAYIEEYLSDFNNPIKNTKEYTDNVIRYIRPTKYIYIRGKYGNTCIDLEPRRMVEINSILENDDGAAKECTQEEWINYYCNYGTYLLPFDTVEKLKEILSNIKIDINTIEQKLNLPKTEFEMPSNKELLKDMISKYRANRVKLQNMEIKYDYNHDLSLISEAVERLSRIRTSEKDTGLKPSIALEKWVNVALNIINDSILIKPNSTVGDDNEPTFTAPAGVPDIECYYDEFNATCEVTTLTSRDQWYNEGQPVMRHLRDFETVNTDKDCYCLFIAPSLHRDTINTYYQSVKYEYEGTKQKIIPLTIAQLIEILKIVAKVKATNKEFRHIYIKELYDNIIDSIKNTDSNTWVVEKIPAILNDWKNNMEKLVA